VIAPDASVLLHRPRLVWTREKAAQLRTLPEEKRHALADCLFALEAALAGIIADRTGSDASRPSRTALHTRLTKHALVRGKNG
jgi:hypothetical protein